jgi:hypothetical protein
LKLSLKKHADQNEFPVDGLGLDDSEQPAEAPEPEPEPESEPDSDNKMNAVPAETAMSADVPLVADTITNPESTVPTSENSSAEPAAAPAPAPEVSPDIPEMESSSDSDSGSGSESELEDIPVNESNPAEAAGESVTPDIESPEPEGAEAEASGPEPGTPAAPGAQPAEGDKANSLFSGGKNHYLQSLKKNKTHRHHKRRNRHQTLRKK